MSWNVDLQVDMEGSMLKFGCRRTRETSPSETFEVRDLEESRLVTIDLDELSAEVREAIEKALLPEPVPKP